MNSNKLKNIIRTIKVDTTDENFPDFKKIDPGFSEVIRKYYEENQVQPSEESYQKLMKLVEKHKNEAK